MIFLFEEEIVFCSQGTQIFVFLKNAETSKSETEN